MSLNQLGLGFQIVAEDLSANVIKGADTNISHLRESAEKASEKMKEIGEGMERIGAGLAAFGLGGLVFLGVATAKAYEMEEALKAVRSQTNEATFPMERMEELTAELSERFGTLPIDQAKAMFLAAEKGARSAAEAEAVLTAANALGKTSHLELGESISLVTQLVKAYGMGLEHAGEAADMLREAALKGNVPVAELGGALEHFAPSAQRAGIGAQELLGAIAAMGAAGIQGRPALAGLKGVIDALIEPSKEAQIEARRLGIEFNAAAVQSKGLPEVLREIDTSAGKNKETLKNLFGSIEAGTAALALMKDNGRALAESVEDIGNSMGRTAAEAEALVTPQQRFAALKEQALELIGKALLPIVDGVTKIANAFLSAFTKIPQPVIAVGTVIAALAFGFLFVAGTAIAAAGAFLAMDGALLPLLGLTAAILAHMLVLGAVLAAIAAPVVLVIYGLKKAFDENLGGIRDTFEALYTKVKLVWDALTQVFRDGGFSGQVLADLDKAGNEGIQPFVIKVFVWFNRIKAFFEGLSDGFDAGMKRLAPVFTMLGKAFDELGDALGQLFGGANDPEANAKKFHSFESAGESVGRALTAVVKVGTLWLTGLINLVTMVVHAVGYMIDAWGVFKDVASNAIAILEYPLQRIVALIEKVADKVGLGGLARLLGGSLVGTTDVSKGGSPGGDNRALAIPAPPGAPPQAAGTSPGLAAARAAEARLEAGRGSETDRQLVESMAGILHQLKTNANAPPPVITLDGEKVGEILDRRKAEAGARNYEAAPFVG